MHKPQREVERLSPVQMCSFAPSVFVFVSTLSEKIANKSLHLGVTTGFLLRQMKSFLDQYVVGQERAKRKLSVAVYNHYKRLEANSQANESDVEIKKSNVLLIGQRAQA